MIDLLVPINDTARRCSVACSALQAVAPDIPSIRSKMALLIWIAVMHHHPKRRLL
jgi:hypothetical protein